MNKITYIILFFFSIIGTYSINAQSGYEEPDAVVSGKVRIKFKESAFTNQANARLTPVYEDTDEVGIQSVDAVSKSVGITKIKRVFPFSPKFEAKHRKYNLHLWYEVEFDSAQSPAEVISYYEGLAEIDIIKPVYKKTRIDGDKQPVIFRAESKNNISAYNELSQQNFDDPLLTDQWHYENDGRFGEDGSDIDLFSAWEITSGSSDIIVAIVDQGVDFNHEDLKANMWVNEAELNGEEGVDDDGNGYIDDFYGYNFNVYGPITPGDHGTHVAGTVGAVNNNGIGVAGVAGGNGSGNGVKLMSTQVFDTRNNGGLNFAEAIVYGADNGAIISQNSWGYNRDDYYEPEVLEAIRYFIAEAGQYEGSPMKGGILFFASGNSAIESIRYPGAFEEVVAVSSTGPTGFPAPYTNFGNWIDISAPGGDSFNFGDEAAVLSTLVGDQYGYMDGTSMACPHVSGVAALVISKFGGDNFTPNDLRRILLNSTVPFKFQHNNKYGKGILNAAKSLVDDNRIPPNPITDLIAAETFHNEIRLEWTVPDDEDGFSPSSYYLAVGESPINAANFDNQVLFLIQNNKETGEKFNINIGGLFKETDYYFAVKSADQFENISEISNILKATTSSEPHFMSSVESITLEIDVNESPLTNVPISFSNISEGIIYWETAISNETYFREPEIVQTAEVDATIYYKEGLADASISSIEDGVDFEPIKYLTSEEVSQSALASTEHWENDSPEFIAGISYENGTPPAFLAGSGNTNAGLIFASRFDVPYDYALNLTHLEVALIPETNKHPIVVEIKRGSRKDLSKAETVYMQEYYPDTTNVLKYYRIPLYKPQKFQDNESFWVVLHYPKEMLYPMVLQFAADDELYDHFLQSKDNGRTYDWATSLALRPVIPMLRAFSTGDDGSYVFFDPNQGEIPQFSNQDVNITVDANALTNGNHLASIGIYTNDIHKPINNIELKLLVKGHKPKLNNSETLDFEGYVNVDNELQFDIENSGYGNATIRGYTFSSSGATVNLTDSVLVKAQNSELFEFSYKPIRSGLINETLTLHTDEGDFEYNLRIISENEPSMSLALASSTIDVEYGSEAELSLTITNSSTDNVELIYDLNDYSLVKKRSGELVKKVNYTFKTSDDVNGPAAGIWDDISSFGTTVESINYTTIIPIGFKFPYFDQYIEEVEVNRLGQLAVLRYAAFIPFKIDGKSLQYKTFQYFSFGDRLVVSFNAEVWSYGEKGYFKTGETVEYQIVLFRDGTVEYRYKDIQGVASDTKSRTVLVGIEIVDNIIVKEFEDPEILKNDMVIRFNPTRRVTMVSETSSLNGTIQKGKSETVTFAVDPAFHGLQAGSYNDFIYVSNNTSSKLDSIPVTINVTGCVNISVPEALAYDSAIVVGSSLVQYLQITNTCANPVTLNSVISDQPEFVPVAFATPVIIEGNSKMMIPIEFIPGSVGNFVGTLSLSYDNFPSQQVAVTAQGTGDVNYITDLQTPVSVSLIAGEEKTIPFNITNLTIDKDLQVRAINSALASVSDLDSGIAVGNVPIAGQTNYGYNLLTSDSSMIANSWESLDLKEGKIDFDNENTSKLELPFEFPFFGNKYESVWIGRNGYLSIMDQTEPSQIRVFPGIEFYGVMAPFWAKLRISPIGSSINYHIEDDKLIVQWTKLKGFYDSQTPGDVTFQAEINSDGEIIFRYLDIDGWGAEMNYGIISPDGKELITEGKDVFIVRWANVSDSSTFKYIPPQHSLVKNQAQKEFNLTVKSDDILYSGIYNDTVRIFTNSVTNEQIEIPVEINISGMPELSPTDNIEVLEKIYTGPLAIREPVILKNTGMDVLAISNIKSEGLESLTLYNEQGIKIVKSVSGSLINDILINPAEEVTIFVEFPISQKLDVLGKVVFSGNFSTRETIISCELVDSPIFSWTAVDQTYNLSNTTKENYTFSIDNNSESTLKFNLIPATLPEVAPFPLETYESEVIGNYDVIERIAVDSLSLEFQNEDISVFVPFTTNGHYVYANRFTSPDGGFNLTHVKTYTNIFGKDRYILISVYVGGDMPQDGRKVYEQKFVVDEIYEDWIYFPLEKPFFIPEGESFYVIITLPEHTPEYPNRYIGIEKSDDPEVYKNSFSGNFRPDGNHYWSENNFSQSVYKIRALTSSGKDNWLSTDARSGTLAAGESIEVTATIDAEVAGRGSHLGKLLIRSNDQYTPLQEASINLNVNGSPELDFYPNMYEDTVQMVETESKVFNYLFNDPEGESATATLIEAPVGLEYEFTQTSSNTAQLSVHTNYESSGHHDLKVKFADAMGNAYIDTVRIHVVDKNRPPVFNMEYEVITLNLADSNRALTLSPMDLFSDDDGDNLQLFAGNYSPEIVDMAIGQQFINLNPLKVGTGQLVFAADDGREDGFVLHIVYVVVIDDPSKVGGVTDGLNPGEVEKGLPALLYPNPVVNQSAKLYYQLEEESNVSIEIYDYNGQLMDRIDRYSVIPGDHTEHLRFNNIAAGIYICILKTDHLPERRFKIIVK
ncbi:S8 family serine peptidase [Marinigracilibium pacificum]|uniref:S8 family serine peptidase n=1 Tax=Marinigracilibium pacificum TaxID=2729599 RepID=A0A848IYG7_9BACT|nr:S8 family serine peptidase [Marinigracilibium pacificum]NMM48325.1 S8 family serine peptidase [Marinigracilibium pacificum]